MKKQKKNHQVNDPYVITINSKKKKHWKIKNKLLNKTCETCLWRSITKRLDGWQCTLIGSSFLAIVDRTPNDEIKYVELNETCEHWIDGRQDNLKA